MVMPLKKSQATTSAGHVQMLKDGWRRKNDLAQENEKRWHNNQRERLKDNTPVVSEPLPKRRCGQIEQMRAENPDVWGQIDEFLDHGSSLEECLDDLVYPRGSCQNCGYNLFGNISGICPECGDSAEPTPAERSLRSCQTLSRLRIDNRTLWKQIEERERLECQALKERTDMEKARKRRERREQALQSSVEWVRQRERANA